MKEKIDKKTEKLLWIIASRYFGTGLYSHKSVEDTFRIIRHGWSLGLTPAESLAIMEIIDGELSIAIDGLAKILRLWGCIIDPVKVNDKVCMIRFAYKDFDEVISVTSADACEFIIPDLKAYKRIDSMGKLYAACFDKGFLRLVEHFPELRALLEEDYIKK